MKLPHLNQVLHHYSHNNNSNQDKDEQEDLDEEEREEPLSPRSKEKGLAFHEYLSGEKHHQKKNGKKEKKNQKEGYEYRYQYQYDRYGQQTQQRSQQHPSASKKGSTSVIRGYDSTSACHTTENTTATPALKQHAKHKKDYKRVSLSEALGSTANSAQSGKMKSAFLQEPPRPEPLLLPKGHTGERASNLNDRKKHPRLNGADLYVARLGSGGVVTAKSSGLDNSIVTTGALTQSATTGTGDDPLASSSSSLPSTSSTSTGSLHDELLNPEPSPTPAITNAASTAVDRSAVRASRPCYRCISYVHSVGIKRVFWTNEAGEWEGGKVRDLVDALDNSMESVAKGGPMGNGVFVTKHEVLMLKRLMGEGPT